ncbi:MAG: hypothetical protein WCG40_05475 [Actinomycetes bacterium]
MRIFGFPIQIRPGFVMFLLLVIVINGIPMGPWLAGSVAFFTVLHELGHAFAARQTGASASISLDFLAGYASFIPVRPLRRWERAAISLAGPLTQIITGIAVLLAMGVNPIAHDSFAANYSSFAIWWAGPVIGALNLIPVLPLDGGNITAEIIDFFVPGQGREMMIRLSVPLTALALAAMVLVENLRPLVAFAAILLFLQLQTLSHLSSTSPDKRRQAQLFRQKMVAEAEDNAWRNGRPDLLHADQVMSPWWEAYSRQRSGHSSPTAVIIEDLLDISQQRAPWWPPHAATAEQLELLVSLLQRPLPEPTADTYELSAWVLQGVLRRTLRFEEAARYGASLFTQHASSNVAIEVARSVCAMGYFDSAAQWITIAGRVDEDSSRLLLALDEFSDLQVLRGRADIEELVIQLRKEVTPPNH